MVLQNLRAEGQDGVAEGGEQTRGGGVPQSWQIRPSFQYHALRGTYPGDVMIAARTSLVEGMRLRLYRFRHDGVYRKASEKNKKGMAIR